ncbi:MAG: putative toxin-antitoxin system toxin component, PIN family [Candidatus Omnitrophica bacterium]|nr:putative toxin-antitoxin system toxin component, PIN family [Candidatus Omnitrophota bacterium]
MLKVVLDTNQFVSGVLTKEGPSARLLQAWRERAYLLITSHAILSEIERVFRYPRIAKKYHLRPQEIENLMRVIEREAVVLSRVGRLEVIKDDPDDNAILACARETEADYLVSGDHHLLVLQRYQGTAIVTARELLTVLNR